MKVIITGGGTGGHIYPALSVAGELKRVQGDGLKLLYAGRSDSMEQRLATAAGFEFFGLPGRPVTSGTGAVRAYGSLALGIVSALRLLARQKPDVVVGTGGYASTAIAAAQAIRKRPLVLMDGNAIPGRTNRVLAKRASAVCTAFEAAGTHLPGGKAVLTGYPVRSDFYNTLPASEARKSFGLEPDTFTMLVVGGSQGAVAINEAVSQCAEQLAASDVQILHQLGQRNNDFETSWVSRWVRLNYIEDMPAALASADLVLSRAGVSSLSEMAAVGNPACLVPYPYAKDDHQRANAAELAGSGCALMLLQKDLNPQALASLVLELKNDDARRCELGNKLRQWGKPDAAERVAAIALDSAKGQN